MGCANAASEATSTPGAPSEGHPPTESTAGATASTTDASTTDATASTGSAPIGHEPAVACGGLAPGDARACGERARSSAKKRVTCDAGYKPPRPGGHCPPTDLRCIILLPYFQATPISQAAPDDEVAACLDECDAGNGASCYRVGLRLSQSRDADETCAHFYLREACMRGLARACDRLPQPCRLGELAASTARDRIAERCRDQKDSWACFYQGYDALLEFRMPEARAHFQMLCSAPCASGRCYKEAACKLARQLASH
jgi:hypothetical protein